jgi:hypothetical protein
LTTLSASPNVAATPQPDESSPALLSPYFFGAQSPGWLVGGTPGLSDSVVSEQANFLVRRPAVISYRVAQGRSLSFLSFSPRVLTNAIRDHCFRARRR